MCPESITFSDRSCSVSGGRAMLGRMTTVCFVGAGSAEFTRQLLRDLLSYPDLGPLDLVMHDIDPRRLRLAEQIGNLAVERHGRPATVRASADRRAALAGVDFVINAVNIGGHDATVTDLAVPAGYRVRETIGGTLRVGRGFRGPRNLPLPCRLGPANAAG